MTDDELNSLVAEKVMGWRSAPHYNYWMTYHEGRSFELHALIAEWKPSTSIADAWQVVEKLSEKMGVNISNVTPIARPGTMFWRVTFFDGEPAISNGSGNVSNWTEGVGESPSMPRAICLAALKSVGVEVK